MARIFITGSADGLGQLAATSLADQGHQVVIHARNSERGRYAKQTVPGAEHAISGDLSDVDETKNVAYEANTLGRFDAVLHNAGVYRALDLPELRHASTWACKPGKLQEGQ